MAESKRTNSAQPKEIDHLRSTFVTAATSVLFIGCMFISWMVAHELYGLRWQHMLVVSLLVLVVPYIIASSALLHIIYGRNFFCMKLDRDPLFILCGLEHNHCCSSSSRSSNSCISSFNFLIKCLAFTVTVFWIPILNLFLCPDDQYFNAIYIQLCLVLMNTANHLSILCMVPPQSMLAMLCILSCRVAIFYILLFIFIFTYGYLSQQIRNYKQFRYVASLTICIELLQAFIMITITCVVRYDDAHLSQYIFTVLGFANYLYPNFPFKKSRLLIQLAYKASETWLWHFVFNGDVSDIYHRFYIYLHQRIFHVSAYTPYRPPSRDECDETVALLVMDHAGHLPQCIAEHEMDSATCVDLRRAFLMKSNSEKLVRLKQLVRWMHIRHGASDSDVRSIDDIRAITLSDYGCCTVASMISTLVACVFPVVWLFVVFESSLVPGWMNVLIYGSIVMYVGFMVRAVYTCFKFKAAPKLLALMLMIHASNAAEYVEINERDQMTRMYKQNQVILCLHQALPETLASVVSPVLLQYVDVDAD